MDLDYLESILVPINETDACYIKSCESGLFVWEDVYDDIPPPGEGLTYLIFGLSFLLLCILVVVIVWIKAGPDACLSMIIPCD